MKAVQLLMMNKKISGWDLSTASYDSKSFSVSGQSADPYGLFFKADGTKMYMVGRDGYNHPRVYQYSLSTAWDISTASYDNVSFSVVGQETQPEGLFFKADGTKMYIIGRNRYFHQYSLSTAWDISTASYDYKSAVYSADTYPHQLYFKPDGTKVYVVDEFYNSVRQYSLSTAWDVSTISYDNVEFGVVGQSADPYGLFFKADGTKMYMGGNAGVFQYSLSTAWNISTASYDSVRFSSPENLISSLHFKPDGTKVYVLGRISDTVFQCSLT